MSRHNKIQKPSFGNNSTPKKSNFLNQANSWRNPYQESNAEASEQPINTVKPPTTEEWLKNNILLRAIETRQAQLQKQQLEAISDSEQQLEPTSTTPLEAIQAKLTVGTPGDKYEQEADQMAEQVMSMDSPTVQQQPIQHQDEELSESIQKQPLSASITPLVQRFAEVKGQAKSNKEPLFTSKESYRESIQLKALQAKHIDIVNVSPNFQAKWLDKQVHTKTPTAKEQPIQRQSEESEQLIQRNSFDATITPYVQCLTKVIQRLNEEKLQAKASPSLESRLASQTGGGSPLDEQTRSFMEPRFGADFNKVRVHTDTTAVQMNKELGAKAFAHGSDVYFGEGQSPGKNHLTAHELTHVVQQGGGIRNKLIQRQDDPKKKDIVYVRFQVKVPEDYTNLEQMYRLFERYIYGKEINYQWSCGDYCDMSKNRGQVVPFLIPKIDVEAKTDPTVKKEREQYKRDYGQLQGEKKTEITEEVNKRYFGVSGDKPGTQIQKGEEGKTRLWEQQLSEVMKEKENLEKLPPEIQQLMGAEGIFKPHYYRQLLRIAEKLKRFGPEDFAVYKLLAIKATDKLDLFEKSVDMYLARKEELKKALEEQQQNNPKEPTMQDAINEKWQGLDESAVGNMSEDERYQLARQKTSELTGAQLKFMQEHPGQTLTDFAKSATLMNTGETFNATSKDLIEAASGDANAWARWAAGAGAGAKISGWLLAVGGILYVASWLTGVGELATIAAAAAVLLGATVTLSVAESELRIKAASQAKEPEEFKRNVELAAAARTNVILAVSMMVVAAVLHFTAKALFPKTIQNINTSLKNFRERIRLKGSVSELKPEIVQEMGLRKGELAKATELAKQKALDAAKDLEGLNTEQFVETLEKGDSGFMDQSKLPPEQKLNYRELLKTPEGRSAIEGYKQKLVNALKIDVIAEIEKLSQEYASKIDEFLKDIDAAKNHDDLKAATDKLDDALTEEHMKKFMQEEQENITNKKIEESAKEAHKEVLASIKEAIVNRVKDKVNAQPDEFQLTYNEEELQSIINKGKDLGLSDKVIEDLIYIGSRKAKAISLTDLMQQMENWANDVSKRGFPYKFAEKAEFQQFSQDLLEGIKKAGLPVDDVRIQGSSLRKISANDVDIAVFVDEAAFDKLLTDRYHERIVINEGRVKVSLKGKSHTELLQLSVDIEVNPGKYNAQGGTFQHAIKNGIINSKSDIYKPLKTARADIAQKYPNLNIETISVLIKDGNFDLQPNLKVKTN